MTVRSEDPTETVIAQLFAVKEKIDDAMKPIVAEAASTIETYRREVKRLRELVRWHEGKPYRSKSDKVPGQLALGLLEMLKSDTREDAKRPDSCQDDKATEADDEDKPKPKRGKRGDAARNLERKVVECKQQPTPCCERCEKQLREIGYDSSERIVHTPAKYFLLEERCFKYAGCPCETLITTEPELPAKPFERCRASASMLAHLVTSRIGDGTPLDRLVRIMKRHGVELPASTLYDWFGRCADLLAPIVGHLKLQLLECNLISLDDTPLKALNRAHPNNVQRGRQWIYIGDVGQVVYAEFSEDWKGRHPRAVLDGFSGDIQGDGYAGINALFEGKNAPRRVGCNDHARRKFVLAKQRGDPRAEVVIDLYRSLYKVEAFAKKQNLDDHSRATLRAQTSVPLWAQLCAEVQRLAANTAKKSDLGKAIIYWQRQRITLEAFLENSHLPISNVHVEQLIRLVALYRKNSLFTGSIEAGKRFANLLTLVLNCILCGANPYQYLCDVISLISVPGVTVEQLTPRGWLACQKAQQADASATAA